ncbi:MAG: hypothetical protein MN733_19245, partial [Nitrososphaera sp.]|nr:hypothetical protein [Nitrososphaera sp.]
AALSSEKISKAQIVLTFRQEYASTDMYDALGRIRVWWENEGKKGEVALLDMQPDNLPRQLDLDRRRVSHWFQSISAMKKEKILDDAFIRLVVSEEQVQKWISDVEPLECVKNPGYDKQVFNTLSSVYSNITRPSIRA